MGRAAQAQGAQVSVGLRVTGAGTGVEPGHRYVASAPRD